ncbi:hypothetical protein ACS191_10995 [Klebsiella pneumoniae]|uniref:hypothetical protein n=1 Tax=Klebsiella pneumoniae TaxID=573 RepID=UPI001082CDF5|nr:hypothetical protein [Klebsiella pneumoniae]VFZ23976.1 Uncharacterised protein [Klebsiella pneumoniae]
MSTMTFVVEFEDGKEPPVHAHMEVFGGKVIAVAFRDALSEQEEQQQVQYQQESLNAIRCFFCNGRHPIGVACPLNTFTSAVDNG